jgi:hypothetical protein
MTLGFSYSNYNRGHRSNETLVINFLKNLMAGWSDKVCNKSICTGAYKDVKLNFLNRKGLQNTPGEWEIKQIFEAAAHHNL